MLESLNLLSIYQVETPLGTVKCGLKGGLVQCQTLGPFKHETGSSILTCSEHYNFESVFFDMPNSINNDSYNTRSFGWLWRIKKLTNEAEPIELFCSLLTKRNENVEFNNDHAEGLDFIKAFNQQWTLVIGTGDGKNVRSEGLNKNITRGFNTSSDRHISFATTRKCGFKTSVPHLSEGECYHIHYLMDYGNHYVI